MDLSYKAVANSQQQFVLSSLPGPRCRHLTFLSIRHERNDVKKTSLEKNARLPLLSERGAPSLTQSDSISTSTSVHIMSSHPASSQGGASEIITGPAATVMREQQETQQATDGKRELEKAVSLYLLNL